MGDYKIVVPLEEASEHYIRNFNSLVGKQLEAVVTEIDKENKLIVASAKLLQEQTRVAIEKNFWNIIFINKIVKGKVERIMPYGAFVSVEGFDCFLHISNISYDKLDKVEDALKVGEEKMFKVIKVDRENKKVELSPEFKLLWDKIKQKTRYSINMDIEKLKKDAAEQLSAQTISAIPRHARYQWRF